MLENAPLKEKARVRMEAKEVSQPMEKEVDSNRIGLRWTPRVKARVGRKAEERADTTPKETGKEARVVQKEDAGTVEELTSHQHARKLLRKSAV